MLVFVGVLFPALPHTALALTVSPVRLELSGDPGETVKGFITLRNEENGDRTFYSSVENFEAFGETGTPRFFESDTGVSAWTSIPSVQSLAFDEIISVPFELTIPENTTAGGYFGAIFWGTRPGDDQSVGAQLNTKLGILILLRVNGDIPEDAQLLEFSTIENESWFSYPMVDFMYRFQNGGGDRIHPVGDMTIVNMFGDIAFSIDANISEGNVLPYTTRRFELSWNDTDNEPLPETFMQRVSYEWNHFAFGRYTAYLNLAYDFSTGTQSTSASVVFWIIPWELLLILVGGLLLLLMIMRLLVRQYNHHIIIKAMHYRHEEFVNERPDETL